MRKHCKRTLALLLLMSLLLGAAAAESPLTEALSAGERLLFETGNVTLEGNAVFSLNGKRFKTVEARYVQDGINSFWQLKLSTPKRDGTELESGYTVIAEGPDYYIMTFYEPGLYRVSLGPEESTLMRRTAGTDQLLTLLSVLLGQTEEALMEHVTVSPTEEGGQKLALALVADDTPALANAALNLVFQFGLRRWYQTEPDTMPAEAEASWDDYLTVTEAIHYLTRQVRLVSADASLTLDAEGRVSGAACQAVITLVGADSSEQELSVDFDVTVHDYGSSRTEPFDPADWDVVLMYSEDADLYPMFPLDFAD